VPKVRGIGQGSALLYYIRHSPQALCLTDRIGLRCEVSLGLTCVSIPPTLSAEGQREESERSPKDRVFQLDQSLHSLDNLPNL